MYEIWLVLNILWEIALGFWPLLVVPTTIRSSLQELGYWVDWANLSGIALAIGVAVLAFAWPLRVLSQRNIIGH